MYFQEHEMGKQLIPNILWGGLEQIPCIISVFTARVCFVCFFPPTNVYSGKKSFYDIISFRKGLEQHQQVSFAVLVSQDGVCNVCKISLL